SQHFYFQAEDGIRDFHVTGVQTCALPISRSLSRMGRQHMVVCRRRCAASHDVEGICVQRSWLAAGNNLLQHLLPPGGMANTRPKIGRASCREIEYEEDRVDGIIRKKEKKR